MDKKLVGLLIANLFAAGGAFAQDESFRLQGSVTLGGIRVDDNDAKDASKLNEYRDLSNGVLTTFDLKGRDSRYWLDAFGENLGRDDAYVTLRGGLYDVFKYRVYTDAMKHNFLFGFLEKARPAFERAEHVELLECTSCGQVTTGTLCAFCKLAERVKAHGSDPASTRR